MKRASCGLDVHFPGEICNVLNSASNQGYEFICLPLAHSRFKREFTAKWKDRQGPFTRPDLVLKSAEWNSLIAGKISPYINVDLECVYNQSKCALEQELSFGSHLDLPAIIFSLRGPNFFNLARIINSNLSGHKTYQIWIEIPMISKMKEASYWRSDLLDLTIECPWEWWNNFKTLCNSDKRLGIILEVTKMLPDQKELNRWIGEPIKCLVIPTNVFLTNKKGYPVLSKPHQMFIKSLVPLDIQIIIKGSNHHYGLDRYQKYINHLWQEATIQENSTFEDTPPSENTIQCPLQPVADNLVSKTYEQFEKDSVKYREYMKAVYCALLDIVKPEEKNTKIVNIMVVGAGRGPLVAAALEAAAKAERKVKVYAVEKNPHAVVTLQAHQEGLWQHVVEIISGDIRYINFSQNIDIMLSELLGAFGDNELSPEVLDEAQKFLRKEGISIPQCYNSHICPVQSSKLYSDLKATKEKADCEMPYVVMQKNKYNISQAQKLFSFHHPNYTKPIDNSRYKRLIFDVEQNCVLHGFTGFFNSVLYKDVTLSIVPDSYTPGLFSWYPLFFPLIEPVQLKAGSKIEVHFWRVVGRSNVWYEWTITKPVPLPVHNPNGRSSNMSLR